MGSRALRRSVITLSLLGIALCGACGTSGPALPVAFGFPQPPVITIAPGSTAIHTLTCAITSQVVGGTTVTGPTYNGRILGPTFRMQPGATDFHVNVVNNLPPNPTGQRAGAFPHDPHTTNLHTHGLTVDPGGISDNVYRVMEPGTTNEVLVQLLPDQPSGTFWYHPHKHGCVGYQMMGGMAGFLIVEGGPGSLDEVPEIAAARDLVMGFQTIRVNAQGTVPFVNQAATDFKLLHSTLTGGDAFMTTNGVVSPTLKMKPGEVVRCRMLNATLGETLALAIVSTDGQRLAGLPLYVLAHDGLTVPQMVPMPVFGDELILGGGNRVDVLIKAPLYEGNFELRTYNTNANGGSGSPVVASISPQGIEPAARQARVLPHPPNTEGWNFPIALVKIKVEGSTNDMPLPSSLLPVPPAIDATETSAILAATPSKTRNILFELCGPESFETNNCDAFDVLFGYDTAAYWGGTNFGNRMFMRDLDNPGPAFTKEAMFKHGEPLFSDMYAGAIEEWTIHNTSKTDHPYHQHVNPFLLTHINGVPLLEPEWRDTVLVPSRLTEEIAGTVTLRMRYHPAITGTFVAHCHILTHEDVGMMQELRIRYDPTLPPR